MATALIDAMTADFDPAAHHDRYQAELDALISAKVSGTPELPPGRRAQANARPEPAT